MYYIGIDTGVNTGVAVWDSGRHTFLLVQTMKIHKAMEVVEQYMEEAYMNGERLMVRVEDARTRTWYGSHSAKEDRARLQGAGSVKRDATIWEDYLTDLGVSFQMVAPKNNATKITSDSFRRLTGWEGRTNEHSRDASMLVFGFR